MASAAELAILITAKDEASAGISRVAGSLGGFGTLALGATAVAAGALVGLGVAAYQLGAEFDDAYDQIRTGTGATGEALEGLKDDFREVATNVPASFDQISQAITQVNQRTGETGPGLQGLATQFLNLSRVTGQDMSASIANVTRLFGDWGIASDDQAGSMDLLYRASQATGIGVNELSGKLVQFGAPLRAMGFDMSEAAVMMGKWEKEGVNTELVLGSLRIAMGKFAKEGVPMREGLDDTIAKIQKLGPGAEATSLAMKTFGARAGPDMAAAILEGRFELGALLDQVKNGSETINAAAEDTADFAEKWQVFSNRVKLAMEPVANAMFGLAATLLDVLMPAFDSAMGAIIPIVTRLAEVIDTALNGDASTAFANFQTLVGEVGANLGTALAEWGAAFLAWIVDAGPPMLAQAASLGQQFLQWIADQLPGVIENLATWAAAFVDWVAPQIPGLLRELGGLLEQFTAWALGTALPAIVSHLVQWGLALVEWVAPRILPLLGELGGMLTGMVGWMAGAALTAVTSKAGEWGGGIIRGLVDGLAGLAGRLQSTISAAISSIRVDAGPFHLSSSGFRIDAPSMPNVSLPGFASGGIVPGPVGAPMLAVVHGGEEVRTPAQQREGRGMPAQGGGDTYIFNGVALHEIADEIDRRQSRRAMLFEGA